MFPLLSRLLFFCSSQRTSRHKGASSHSFEIHLSPTGGGDKPLLFYHTTVSKVKSNNPTCKSSSGALDKVRGHTLERFQMGHPSGFYCSEKGRSDNQKKKRSLPRSAGSHSIGGPKKSALLAPQWAALRASNGHGTTPVPTKMSRVRQALGSPGKVRPTANGRAPADFGRQLPCPPGGRKPGAPQIFADSCFRHDPA